MESKTIYALCLKFDKKRKWLNIWACKKIKPLTVFVIPKYPENTRNSLEIIKIGLKFNQGEIQVWNLKWSFLTE